MKTPKYKIGDVVIVKDDFGHNVANKASVIGKIGAIYVFSGIDERTRKSLANIVRYSIEGTSLIRDEEDVKLYKGGKQDEKTTIN